MSVDATGIKVLDWGRTRYEDAWKRQHELFDAMTAEKKAGRQPQEEYLVVTEHDPVITLGRHAHEDNLLMPQASLRERGVEVFHIERGGDITYHGPGQLVAYPILDLERHRLGVKDYVNILEESVIKTIARFGIQGERVDGASGVWIGKGTARERKICAVGVKCSRFCTMHGLALNVNTDLEGFRMINPCGFTDKGVTSIKEETGQEAGFDDVKRIFSDVFLRLILALEK